MADETEYTLDAFAQATLNASGTGSQINIGPTAPNERWVIEFLSASGSAPAKLQVMRGNSFDGSRQLDVTTKAQADSSNTSIKLQSGERISFWWTSGTPGAVMMCSIQGSRFVRGKRGY